MDYDRDVRRPFGVFDFAVGVLLYSLIFVMGVIIVGHLR